MNPSQKSEKVAPARPKRPLSAYNLYYRFKRQKVVQALAQAGGAMDKAAIRSLVESPPGLEDVPNALGFPRAAIEELRRERIIRELQNRIEARDNSSRSHRRDRRALNGGMGFLELATVMKKGWENCDSFAMSVFQDLAEEGRERYRRVLMDYKIQVKELGLTKEDLAEGKTSAQVKKKQVKKRQPVMESKVAENVPSSGDSIAAASRGNAEKEAAEIMIQLQNKSPARDHDVSNSLDQKGFDGVLAPTSLPGLLSKQDTPLFPSRQGVLPPSRRGVMEAQLNGQLDLLSKQDAAGVEAIKHQRIMTAESPCTLPAAFGPSRQIPSSQIGPRATAAPLKPPFQTQVKSASPTYPPKSDAITQELEQVLMLRIRRLRDIEGQLAERRLRSRIQELEYEMARRSVREGLMRRTALGNVISHEMPSSGPGALLRGGLAQAQFQTGFNRPVLTPPNFGQFDMGHNTIMGEASARRASTGQYDLSRTGPARAYSSQRIAAQVRERMPGTALDDARAHDDAVLPPSQTGRPRGGFARGSPRSLAWASERASTLAGIAEPRDRALPTQNDPLRTLPKRPSSAMSHSFMQEAAMGFREKKCRVEGGARKG